MLSDSFFRSKHPLWRLFGIITIFIIILPAMLWGIVQFYEIFCAWWGGCEGITRPRGSE